jgi:hypothetical protein
LTSEKQEIRNWSYAPFERICRSYSLALSGLSPEAVETHPGADPLRWNIRQVVEHLVLTYRLSSGAQQERLAKQRPTKATASAMQLCSRTVILKLGYFPRGRPAPASVTPSPNPAVDANGVALSSLFSSELHALDEVLNRCEACFGQDRFASHHVLGPLSGAEWRRFHLLHASHHLRQIERIKASLGNDLSK